MAEYNDTGTLQRRYVHGPGVDEPVLWYEGSGLGSRRHLRADHQGSVVAVTGSTGTSLAINSYDEYGKRGSGNLGRFQYTGQILIPEVRLYYYKARMYSAELGRFLQTDPIGYEDQMNLYAYVGNDPTNLVDPSGRELKFSGDDEHVTGFLQVLGRAVEDDPQIALDLAALAQSSNTHEIRPPDTWQTSEGTQTESPNVSPTLMAPVENASNGVGTNSSMAFDPDQTLVTTNSDGSVVIGPPESILIHEVQHMLDVDTGTLDISINPNTGNRVSEDKAMSRENVWRQNVGLTPRDYHGAK